MNITIIIDKSTFQSLSFPELYRLSGYYKHVITPVLTMEILGDLKKEFDDVKKPSEERVKDFANKLFPVDTVRYFVFEGLATIGFIYLPGLLSVEEEYRLLVQRPSAKLFQLVSGRVDEHEYIELPLFQHPLANVRISKIVVSNKAASEQVVKLLSENESFADVRIETMS